MVYNFENALHNIPSTNYLVRFAQKRKDRSVKP